MSCKLHEPFPMKAQSISAKLLLASVILIFGAHAALFIVGVGQTTAEQHVFIPDSAASIHTSLLTGLGALTGEPLLSARLSSLLCGVITIILGAWYGSRISGDDLCGAALTVGFVFFPPVAFAVSQATPHGYASLLLTVAIVVSDHMSQSRPLGYRLAAGLFGGLLVVVAATTLSVTARDPSPAALSLADAVVLPYAMLWVALGFSLLALIASQSLRQILGRAGLYRAVLHFGVFGLALMWLWFTFGDNPETLRTAFSAIFVLGLLAVMPMVMWIRMVMPRFRSILVWIVLPVVMYSCFWAILGPIDLDGFPYDGLRTKKSLAGPQAPG